MNGNEKETMLDFWNRERDRVIYVEDRFEQRKEEEQEEAQARKALDENITDDKNLEEIKEMERKKELQKMEKMYQEFLEEFMAADGAIEGENEEEEEDDDY